MKKRLENRRWIVEDIQGNIDEEQRILFVCIGRKFNRSIMNLTNKRMKKVRTNLFFDKLNSFSFSSECYAMCLF